MLTMFSFSIRQMSGRRRIAIIGLLTLLPVGLAIVLHAFVGDDHDFTDGFNELVLDGLLIGVILPIVVMTLATAAFGNELEDRTLNVLVLKPLPRFALVLPKFLASVLISGGLLGASMIAIMLIALSEHGLGAIVAAVVAVLAGVVAYSALFTWAGLMTTKALAYALVYVFVWEQLLTRFLTNIQYLSVRGYTLAILNGLDEETFSVFDRRVIQFPAAIGGVLIVSVLFVWLTVRRLKRMDVQ